MSLKINKKLLLFFLAIIFLILAIITIRTTYARYVTALTAKSTVELGSWLILVNNQNILNNSNVSDWVFPSFNENTEYIANGVIAPTSTGNVTITLDYSKVTVPFKYDISFATATDTLLEDFVLKSYSVDGGEAIEITEENPLVSDTIAPTDTTRTRTLKLNFEWVDDNNNVLNDIANTAFTRNNEELGLRFTMEFTQLQPTT